LQDRKLQTEILSMLLPKHQHLLYSQTRSLFSYLREGHENIFNYDLGDAGNDTLFGEFAPIYRYMNKRSFYTFFLVVVAMSVHGQMRFSDGFIVNNAGDTLRGFIGVTEKDVNPIEVTFKSSLTEEPKTYPLQEVRYFSATGIVSYQRFNVSVSMDPIDLDEVRGYNAPQPERKTVFLKVMQRGKVIELFSYRDELKIRFFIIHSHRSEPQELVYKVLKVNGNFVEAFAFRDVLRFIAEREGIMTSKLKSRIRRTEYTQHQILRIVSEMNGVTEQRVSLANAIATGFTAGAGLNLARLHYYGTDEYAKNAKSSPSSLYWLSVGYDIAKNPYVGKMVFRGDVTVSFAKFRTTTHDYRYSSELDILHTFKQRTVAMGAYGLYNFRNEERFKLFLSAGVRANFSSYDNDYELRRTSAGSVDIIPNKDAEPRRIWASIPLEVGAVVAARIEVGVAYIPNMVLSHGDFPYKFGINSIETGILYHF
jgi:hypothetical protein